MVRYGWRQRVVAKPRPRGSSRGLSRKQVDGENNVHCDGRDGSADDFVSILARRGVGIQRWADTYTVRGSKSLLDVVRNSCLELTTETGRRKKDVGVDISRGEAGQ